MQFKRFKYFGFCFVVAFSASADEIIYVAKHGETISDILFQNGLGPIYGKKGLLNQVLLLNPKLKKKLGNKIYPGEKIRLPQNALSVAKVEAPKSESTGKTLEPELNKNSESDIDHEQYIFYSLSPQVSWLKAVSASIDQYQISEVSALSKAIPGVLGTYGMKIKDNLSVHTFVSLADVKFYRDERYRLTRDSFFRSSYGLGVDYRLDSVNRFSLSGGFFDEFFLTMSDSSTINIETAQFPEIHWGYRRLLGEYKKVSFDSGIWGKFIIPYKVSSIDGKLGFGIGGDFLLKFKEKGLRFFYNFSNAKGANKSTRTHELGWNIVFEGKSHE